MASSVWCGIAARSRAFVRRHALITTGPGFEPKSASARVGRTVFGWPAGTSFLTPARNLRFSKEHHRARKCAAIAAHFAFRRRVVPESFRDRSLLPASLFPLG